MEQNEGFLCADLNPTFLFTWKGIRTSDEKNYHEHNYLELAFVLSGQAKYRIDDQLYSIKEGDLLILNPGMKHQALVDHQGVPTVEFFVGASNFQFEGMDPNSLNLAIDGPIYHTSGDLKLKLFRLCSSIAAENEFPRAGRYYMLKSYLMQMLLLIIRDQEAFHVQEKRYVFESTSKKYIVEKIMTYFEDHYAEKISLDQIAENMYLSPFYISKIFKLETGDAPIRHLINIRLQKANEILTTEDSISIQEVAARVGYDDAYHFSKQFKKHFGVSPSSIKKESTQKRSTAND